MTRIITFTDFSKWNHTNGRTLLVNFNTNRNLPHTKDFLIKMGLDIIHQLSIPSGDERLNTKTEGGNRVVYTGLCG